MRRKSRVELLQIFLQTTGKTESVLPMEIVQQIVAWILGENNQFEELIAAIEAEQDQMRKEGIHA